MARSQLTATKGNGALRQHRLGPPARILFASHPVSKMFAATASSRRLTGRYEQAAIWPLRLLAVQFHFVSSEPRWRLLSKNQGLRKDGPAAIPRDRE